MSKDKKKVKPAEKVKNPKVDSKLVDKSKASQKELELYLKANKLDPTKDWTKDKKHGAKVKELLSVINTSRDKVKAATPEEKHHKKSDDKKGEGKAQKAVKYDYPKVDGREMTSGEKKKYRVKMRSGSADKPAKVVAEKTEKAAKPEKKSDKTKTVVKTEKKVEKSGKKSGKDKKKDKKKED